MNNLPMSVNESEKVVTEGVRALPSADNTPSQRFLNRVPNGSEIYKGEEQ